jgi:hypothetical protein
VGKTSKLRKPPTPKTLKRLFSLSGNMCANPKCENVIVNHKGSVIGRVCHIAAAEKGGPRFNPKLSSEEARAFENLILLCANCHVVVDEEEATYTVHRLQGWKSAHEARFASIEEKLRTAYLDTISEETSASAITIPKDLNAFSKHLEEAGVPHEIDGGAPAEIEQYARRLRNLTTNDRLLMRAIIEKCFVLPAARHYSNGVGAHPDDLRTITVNGRPLTLHRMNRLGEALDRNRLGSLDPDGADTVLFINSPHDDLDWLQLSEYLEKRGTSLDALLIDLDFALLD